ncbi:hypothetical protein [uncultured Planktosalinus sp.]|uniref:hypothetical protein n=1 Tax=uncultured Planktosalinus sp. TaxID=1810935 RepID=UPI0030DAFFE7
MNKILFLGIACLFFSCKETPKPTKEKESASFSEIQLPEIGNSSLPYLFSDGKDLLLSFISENAGLATLYFSKLDSDSWSTPEVIASGADWFINWADYPQIAKNGENYIAHFLQKSDTATFAYDVIITQKKEKDSWSKPLKIHSDTTKTEHGFVSYIPFGNSQFLVNWLDGRNTTGGSHSHGAGAMSLRSAIVNPDGSLESELLIDDRVCDCCQTSSAMTANGPVVVYRDRLEGEVRDISIVRLEEGIWSTPVSVHNDNWQIHGCPVNGPRVDAIDNVVAVAWFTAAEDESKVNLAFSTNNGADFNKPMRLDSGNPIGRVDVALIDTQNAVVSWMEVVDDSTYIKFRNVTLNGELGEIKTLTNTSESRGSGFPQMVVFNNEIYFAWTLFKNEIKHIKTTRFSINDFEN